MPVEDQSLEAGEQYWNLAESVDGDGSFIGYWASVS